MLQKWVKFDKKWPQFYKHLILLVISQPSALLVQTKTQWEDASYIEI